MNVWQIQGQIRAVKKEALKKYKGKKLDEKACKKLVKDIIEAVNQICRVDIIVSKEWIVEDIIIDTGMGMMPV